LFPYTTLFRSAGIEISRRLEVGRRGERNVAAAVDVEQAAVVAAGDRIAERGAGVGVGGGHGGDRGGALVDRGAGLIAAAVGGNDRGVVAAGDRGGRRCGGGGGGDAVLPLHRDVPVRRVEADAGVGVDVAELAQQVLIDRVGS